MLLVIDIGGGQQWFREGRTARDWYVSLDVEAELTRADGTVVCTDYQVDACKMDLVAIAKHALLMMWRAKGTLPTKICPVVHGPCRTYSVLLQGNVTHRRMKSATAAPLRGPAGGDARCDDGNFTFLAATPLVTAM